MYFVAYALADAYQPLWDGPCELQHIFTGEMCENDDSPFCFLRLGVVYIPGGMGQDMPRHCHFSRSNAFKSTANHKVPHRCFMMTVEAQFIFSN